ncbi:ribosome small subunit-dependent GTPase A [Phenylobacterium sp.]|uniref:ribosome small subunit-dependent GTPase A n=1 Tax=Phenylobacterium sp. TaxID=1871053 RepID=UPI0035ADD99B
MIDTYGWSERLQQQFVPHAAQGLVPGRVIVQQRGLYRLATPHGELAAELSGRFVHEAQPGDHPVAGDWTACLARPGEGRASIRAVLPRDGVFRRKDPDGGVQVVAAHVDVALLAASLNADLSLRRLERYLAAAWESGATPAIVLTKAALCPNVEDLVLAVETIAFGAPVLTVSALEGEGLEAVRALLPPGRTGVLLGSSGVGKSTLVNALVGEDRMATREIREDDAKGRHTTTHRELVVLPGGGLLLDTPGMRELGLWDADEGVAATFADVEALAAQCRFSDCAHEHEPGCAIQAAIEAGELDADRWRGYVKLQRELAWLDRRDDPLARREQRRVWTHRTKTFRAHLKQRDRER